VLVAAVMAGLGGSLLGVWYAERVRLHEVVVVNNLRDALLAYHREHGHFPSDQFYYDFDWQGFIQMSCGADGVHWYEGVLHWSVGNLNARDDGTIILWHTPEAGMGEEWLPKNDGSDAGPRAPVKRPEDDPSGPR
jgi:hypothetical protein